MKRGDIYMVYNRPASEEESEGEAEILEIRHLLGKVDGRQMFFCKVKFLKDGYITERMILAKTEG